MKKYLLLPSLLLALSAGCAIDGETSSDSTDCAGEKCDTWGDSTLVADLGALRSRYGASPAINSMEDVFSLTVRKYTLPDGSVIPQFKVPTHVLDEGQDEVTIIPFTDSRSGGKIVQDAMGADEIVISMKNHRPEHRDFNPKLLEALTLAAFQSTPDTAQRAQKAFTEELKLQDTHMQAFVVGRSTTGQQRVVPLQSPQAYPIDTCNGVPCGNLGTPDYSPIIFKLRFPAEIEADTELRGQFLDNMKTMLMGFHAVAHFPSGNYNGGDDFKSYNAPGAKEYTQQMIRAVAGDRSARAWFGEKEQNLYCSEYAHASLSAGLMYPLNRDTVVNELGLSDDTWNKFQAEIKKYNEHRPSQLVAGRGGRDRAPVGYKYRMNLKTASEDLRPAHTYTSSHTESLAFSPVTGKKLMDNWVDIVFNIEKMAPQVGGVEAAKQIRQSFTAFLQSTAFYQQNAASSPASVADYTPSTIYAPPNLAHYSALNKHDSFLNLDYIGHLIHENNLSNRPGTAPVTPSNVSASECEDLFTKCLVDAGNFGWRTAQQCETDLASQCEWSYDIASIGTQPVPTCYPESDVEATQGACLLSSQCSEDGGTPQGGFCPGSSGIKCCVH